MALVGRMLRSKGVPDAVASVRLLRAEGLAIELVLAGPTDPDNPDSLDDRALAALAAEPGSDLAWLGRVEDVRKVWAEAAIAVLPSTYGEGLPKSLLEAASCGRAIVASDMPGFREIVRSGEPGTETGCSSRRETWRRCPARSRHWPRTCSGGALWAARGGASSSASSPSSGSPPRRWHCTKPRCANGALSGDAGMAGDRRAGGSRLGDGGRARGASGNGPRTAELLRTGSLYGMVHAAALVAVIALAQGREPRRGPATIAGWGFAVGIVLFSGSLFALAAQAGRWAGWIAPAGGAALMLGWGALAVLALRRR